MRELSDPSAKLHLWRREDDRSAGEAAWRAVYPLAEKTFGLKSKIYLSKELES
jgi:hypothetical protein